MIDSIIVIDSYVENTSLNVFIIFVCLAWPWENYPMALRTCYIDSEITIDHFSFRDAKI